MEEESGQKALANLRRELIGWVLISCAGLFWLKIYVARSNPEIPSVVLVAAVLLPGMVFFIFLWNNLNKNRFEIESPLYSTLGLANHISIFRGILIAYLAGFILFPSASGWVQWAPGILFSIISILDFADGAAARLTGRTTVLGEALDMSLDGLGILLASLILVLTGKAPIVFLLVGLARYFYLIGQWVLRKYRKPIHPLPPNPYRRALAGMMMGYMSVALFPVFSSQITQLTAVIFLIPFGIGFIQDFLYTSGVITAEKGIKRPRGNYFEFILFFLRMAAGFFLLLSPVFMASPWKFTGYVLMALCAAGVLPRLSALAILIFTASLISISGSDGFLWACGITASVTFFLGGGRFAVWSPEDDLITRRVGESV